MDQTQTDARFAAIDLEWQAGELRQAWIEAELEIAALNSELRQ